MNLVGRSKAFGLAAMADQIIDDENLVTYIEENVLYPSQPQKLEVAFSEAQVILDASTSIAAARYLTYDIQSAARRISMFLNPTATAVVILAEDCERLVKLDMLEMQYYRGLLEEPNLEKHLDQGDERVRYGTSCRDLSSKIPQDLVALHSAISSRALRGVIDDRNASTTIWSTDLENITTSKYAIPVGTVREIILGDWTLKTDSIFLEKVTQLRAGKLPNETGGVLIGSYDTDRKIVFVIDTIPAPPDSLEWPTVFIRGSEGLRKGVERVRQITKNQLDYVGEWHSHPDGIGSKPSTDDMKAFSWLSSLMAQDGLPGLMLIVADCQCDFYLGKMEA
jgi:integrative and conjugative element protein (TIGR02256 family)